MSTPDKRRVNEIIKSVSRRITKAERQRVILDKFAQYPYIVAWLRATCSFDSYILTVVEQAIAEEAPENAYCKTYASIIDGKPIGGEVWHVYDPATASDHIKQLISYGIVQGPIKS